MNLTYLPYEIGIHIGKFLKPKDLANFTLASSHFSQLCKDEQLFFELYYRDFLTHLYNTNTLNNKNKKQEPQNKKETIKELEDQKRKWKWKEMYALLWETTEWVKYSLKHFYGLAEKRRDIYDHRLYAPYTVYHLHDHDEDPSSTFVTSMVDHPILYKFTSKTPKFAPDEDSGQPVEIHHLDAKNLFLKVEFEVRDIDGFKGKDLIIKEHFLIDEGFVKWCPKDKKFFSMYSMDGLRDIFYHYADKYQEKSLIVNELAREFMNRQYTFKLGTLGTQFFITEDEIKRILNNGLKKHDLEVDSFDASTFKVTCNRKPVWKIPENRCLFVDCTQASVYKNFCPRHKNTADSQYLARKYRGLRNKEKHAEYIAYYKRFCNVSSGGSGVSGFGSVNFVKEGNEGNAGVKDGNGSVKEGVKCVDGVPTCIKVDIKGKAYGFILNMV